MSECVVFCAFLLGGLIHSTAGFGSALVSMPLLTLALAPRVATPLQTLVGLGLSLFIFYQHHEKWPWRDSIALILFSILGIPLGTFALLHLPESVVLGILGSVLLAYAVFELTMRSNPANRDEERVQRDPFYVLGALAGFIAGILGAAYATNGPPAIIYGAWKRWPKPEFKSALQSMFIVNGVCVLIWQARNGMINSEVASQAFFGAPGLACGALLGARIDRQLNHAQFRMIVITLLVVLGLFLILRAWA